MYAVVLAKLSNFVYAALSASMQERETKQIVLSKLFPPLLCRQHSRLKKNLGGEKYGSGGRSCYVVEFYDNFELIGVHSNCVTMSSWIIL